MTAIAISKMAWNEPENRDVRDIVKIASLASNIREAELIIRLIKQTERKPRFDYDSTIFIRKTAHLT